MSKLTVFVSSTVEDFGPVRRDIAEWLTARGIEARLSDREGFPVPPATHSHDVCIRAVDGVHLFVLLVGNRFGGHYRAQEKSITWREYDEALAHRVPTLVFVLKSTNDTLIAAARAAKAAKAGRKHELPAGFDKRIGEFVDHIRKGHESNWMYADWDGSASHITRQIGQTLNDMLVEYQKPYHGLLQAESRASGRAASLAEASQLALRLCASVRRREMTGTAAMARLLAFLVRERAALLGFREDDVYNFMIYRREGDRLVPWVRHAHASVPRHDRTWLVGEAHVGLSVASRQTLVAGDLPTVKGFKAGYDTDAVVYRSAISTPLLLPRKAKESGPEDQIGALVVTSSRLDHFEDREQVESLTVSYLSTILMMIAMQELELAP